MTDAATPDAAPPEDAAPEPATNGAANGAAFHEAAMDDAATAREPKAKKKLKIKIAHKVPGRIRMKISAAKGDPELLEQIKTTFEAIPGLDKVKINPETGSVILKYDPDLQRDFDARFHRHCAQCDLDARRPTNEIDELADKIKVEAEYLAENSETARVVVDLFKKLDREIKSSSGNTVDLKVVLAAAVIAVTVLEVGATAATPVWLTFAVFGLNHLVSLRPSAQRGHTHAHHGHSHDQPAGHA